MTTHDNSYKLLFSHATMVEDLIKGFVNEAWVREVDFSTLEKVSGSFITDDLRDREDDIIWRVRWGRDWIYVYVMLEFQSRTDRYMAVRIMTYLGLLYQELIRTNKLTNNNKLPPVLPIVLYNGKGRWREAVDVVELVEAVPGGLEHYLPRLCYLLLDEGSLDESHQLELRNLAAALFRLEKSAMPRDMQNVVAALSAWLKAPSQTGLRRAFTVFIKRVLLPARMPGIELPELNDLQEVQAMLAERIDEWTENWVQQGIQQGIEQGIEQGIQKGERLVLTRQLAQRFGELPQWVSSRLEQASLTEVETWLGRILEAKTLEEIFQ